MSSSTTIVTEHVQDFARDMLALKPHELEEEQWEFALKQLIAAEVTHCSWAQVCAHVAPGSVQAMRFSSLGQVDNYAKTHENDPALYVAIAAQASFPNAEEACQISPTMGDFWQEVCPKFDHPRAIMAFHALHLNNGREVLAALAKDAGSSLFEQRLIGSASDSYLEQMQWDQEALATELGQLWSAVSFPLEMFASPLPSGPVGLSEPPLETIADAVDEYSRQILPIASASTTTDKNEAYRAIRLHPLLDSYRRHAQLPITFPLGKTLAQLFSPSGGGDTLLLENNLGPRQTPALVEAARAKVDQTVAAAEAESLVLQSMRIASALPELLQTPAARSLYSAVRNKCGTEWIASKKVDGPMLATWLILGNGPAETTTKVDSQLVQKVFLSI